MPVSANQKTEEVLEVETVEMLAELPALGVFFSSISPLVCLNQNVMANTVTRELANSFNP